MPVSTCFGVAYGNGVFVSIYNNILNVGGVYTSADGLAWSRVDNSSLPAGGFYSVAYGAGLFTIVGVNGMIKTSSDGVNWTARTSSTTEHLYVVEFTQGAFYAGGDNTTLRTSPNGITWSTISLNATNSTHSLRSITYGNSKFVIGATTSNTDGVYFYASATAASNSWTYSAITAANSPILNGVKYLKDRFFAFTSAADTYTSTDGTTWTNYNSSMSITMPDATTQSFSPSNFASQGMYDGSKFYFFGSTQYWPGVSGAVFTSTNGVNFTLEPKIPYPFYLGSAYLNGKYFSWGNEGLVVCSDGVTYKFPGCNYNGLATNGSQHVGVGTVVQIGYAYSSPNFNNWSENTPGLQKELNAVVHTGVDFVAVGNETVIKSSNGTSWSQISNPSKFFTAVNFGGGKLVAGGYSTTTNAPEITYSTDGGTTWVTTNTDNNWYFKIRYVNNNFFALGFSQNTIEGVILHSTDGINWTDITPSLGFPVYYYNDVVYDGIKYHFMGMEYDDAATFDLGEFFAISTATPTVAASFGNKGIIASPPAGAELGGQFGEGALAYSNNHFVGAVNDVATGRTHVIYSADGVTWVAVDLNEKTIITGIAASGNIFKMLGSEDARITADFTVIILPVNLLSFNASLKNEQAKITWQTASEKGSDHFDVQHSVDNTAWEIIGSVRAAGSSNEMRSYDLTHSKPVPGYNYYRLVQTDIDGKKQTSKVVRVHLGSETSVSIYPNPAVEYVTVQAKDNKKVTVTLYSAGGQKITTKEQTGMVRLSLQNIPQGLYMIEVKHGATTVSHQLVKQ